MADITILGFGLALAIMCDNAGHKVTGQSFRTR